MTDKNSFHKLPIKSKLIRLIMMISFFALFATTLISAAYEIYLLNNSLRDKLKVVASAIAYNSTAAVTYQQIEPAQEILEALNAENDIEFSAIYFPNNKRFAYNINPNLKKSVKVPDYLSAISPVKNPQGVYFAIIEQRFFMDVFQPIVVDGQLKATLFIRTNLNKALKRLFSFLLAMLAIMFSMMVIIYFAASHFQKLIIDPLHAMSQTANRIAKIKDYTIRMEQQNKDEIGIFIEAFNDMLQVIEDHESELREQRKRLSIQVAQRTQELASERDKALAATNAKSHFLANMSHEIRTPMNALIGMLSLLKQAPLKSEHQSYLETAIFSSENLMKLIDNVLDFSKIEAGKINFETIDFDLQQILAQITQLFKNAAERKNIELNFYFDDQINPVVRGDPTRLSQVINNLVNNAIKFTDQGRVVIAVTLEKQTDTEQQLKFSISDTGIGIDKKDMTLLFQSFTQLDGSTTRKYGGTGLGLTLCKKLIELMGGSIHVESQPGQGSEFWFILNMNQGKAGMNVRKNSEVVEKESPINQLNGRILVTDDDPVNQTVALAMLKNLDLTADIAVDGVIAIKMVNQQQYDVILMDCQMPNMDGYEATQKIRQIQNHPIAIIGLTANVLLSDKQKCLDAGMDDYLPKPITLDTLRNCLVKWLPKNQSPEHSTSRFSIWNVDDTLDHMLQNNELLKEVIGIFLLQYQQRLATMNDAIENNDLITLKDSTHAFKGAVVHFSAPQLHEKIQHFEQLIEQHKTDVLQEQFSQLQDMIILFVHELENYNNV